MSEKTLAAPADPTASLIRSVRRIAQAIDVRSREIARLTGLTLPQLLVLQAIRSLGEVSSQAISREVFMAPPTVMAVLDRLEARGLIERYRSAVDRRVVHSRLTPAGEKALDEAPELLGDTAIRRFAALPDDRRRALAEALQSVSELLDARAEPPGATPPG